jgi:pimeloyl-ACP methyl ester carboxylesterase
MDKHEVAQARARLAQTLLRGRPRSGNIMSAVSALSTNSSSEATKFSVDIEEDETTSGCPPRNGEPEVSAYPYKMSTSTIVDPVTLPPYPREFNLQWTRVDIWVPDAEEPKQSMVPMLMATAQQGPAVRPALVLLHGTGHCAESMVPIMASLAGRGMLVVAPDARHHGRRCDGYVSAKENPGTHQYQQALVEAWSKDGATRPFAFDTAADMFYVADYLKSRPDVGKLGICGVSLGGIHAWLAAAADCRWDVVAPLIGVQSFGSAVSSNRALPRVATIPDVFRRAAEDILGVSSVNGDCQLAEFSSPHIVQSVWQRICPGLLEYFDAHLSLPLIAPRPLFVGNGKFDPRCPIDLLTDVFASVREAYEQAALVDKSSSISLHLRVYDCGHEVTEEMWRDVGAFLESTLLRADIRS